MSQSPMPDPQCGSGVKRAYLKWLLLPVVKDNIGTQGVQELFFCDLKAPGGRSTRWTHKGNSFMCTGVPDSSQRHY